MKNLKKIKRDQLKEIKGDQLKGIKGGAVLPDDDFCGTWCFGVWHPCTINHLACPQ
ncbi:bacteriocin-like protein [Chryseobacterium sp. 52]|uniref:bacteriocin-like protein n=1 Tax=Chryseobacterium sp. 52 TaxID=2035213 RepID=UPI0015D4B19B|nr:hypothetical protein [Chryseobacterium sp. 52]